MTPQLHEAEYEQLEPEPIIEPFDLDDSWKPAAVAIGCIVVALALVAVLA